MVKKVEENISSYILFEKVKSKAQFPLELQYFYFLQVFIQINQKKIKNDTVESKNVNQLQQKT